MWGHEPAEKSVNDRAGAEQLRQRSQRCSLSRGIREPISPAEVRPRRRDQ